jgi:iron-sulfur cluster assembly accessory protein
MKMTDAAATQFKKMLSEAGMKDPGIRVFIAGQGCCGPTFGLDVAANGETDDETLETKGIKVFVDKKASARLSKATIDYDETGTGFHIKGIDSACCS